MGYGGDFGPAGGKKEDISGIIGWLMLDARLDVDVQEARYNHVEIQNAFEIYDWGRMHGGT